MDYEILAAEAAKEDRERQRQQTNANDASAFTSASSASARLIQPKNRSAANTQITAEQILRDSLDSVAGQGPSHPIQTIANVSELNEYKLRKRKEFEDAVRRNRHNTSAWLRYAGWESKHGEIARARSIYERALEIDYRDVRVWTRYVDTEIKHHFIAHARNLLDRATTLLPRADSLWYKYCWLEETLGELAVVREIYQRWLSFHPDVRVWFAAINYEIRHCHYDYVRVLYQRLTVSNHYVDAYLKYAKFEEKYGNVEQSRAVYELCFRELQESKKPETEKQAELEILLQNFAEFEIRHREIERARALYKYLLDHSSYANTNKLFYQYTVFEKQHGDQQSVEAVIVAKRRLQYEEELRANPRAYDVYFDYIALLTHTHTDADNGSGSDSVVSLYQRAIEAVPLNHNEKKHWKQYVYLWIDFAAYTELHCRLPTNTVDSDRVSSIYEKCLSLIDVLPFKFAKLYRLFAEFRLRQFDLSGARKVYGLAIAKCRKPSIYLSYIEMELMLGNIDRVRKIYDKWLTDCPSSSDVWLRFAEFEERLQESERWRKLFELSLLHADAVDRPELLWKSYIESEKRELVRVRELKSSGEELDEHDLSAINGAKVRSLYQQLLSTQPHVKVYLSFAQWALSEKAFDETRQIFTDGDSFAKRAMVSNIQSLQSISTTDTDSELLVVSGEQRVEQCKSDRALLLTAWLEYESSYGSEAQQRRVHSLMPLVVTRRRDRRSATGELLGGAAEEYSDYQFNDLEDELNPTAKQGKKLLELAKAWKLQQQEAKRKEMQRIEAEEQEQAAEPAPVSPLSSSLADEDKSRQEHDRE